MAREPLEQYRQVPTVPDDLLDPPRFGQLVETAKDAFVLELRAYFRTLGITTERRSELPTVEKYAIDFPTNTDPYETFVKVVAEYPDVLERLPHIAVMGAQGANHRFNAGNTFIAHTQLPPRVETTTAAPWALAAAANQIDDLTVVALPGGAPATYTVTVNGYPIAATVAAGVTAAEVLLALQTALRAELDLLYAVDTRTTNDVVTSLRLARRAIGDAALVTASSNLLVTSVQAASAAAGPDQLVFRTTPDKQNPVTSTIVFPVSRFPTTAPPTAATADDVARVFNEQALYAFARVIPVGLGSGIRFETGGPKGGAFPAEIEVLAASSRNLVTQLGLGAFGPIVGGDSITGTAASMTLNVAGASFTADMIGRYVTLTGTGHDGRFLITSAATSVLGFVDPDGTAGALTGGEWFVGLRDSSRNVLRPAQNRHHMSAQLTLDIAVLAESETERQETQDLVWTWMTSSLEYRTFTFYGRGVFDEAYPDENYQISLAQEGQVTAVTEFRRGDDTKNLVHAARLSQPVTITHFIDRQLRVPSGPSVGQEWTLESDNVTPDAALPPKS